MVPKFVNVPIVPELFMTPQPPLIVPEFWRVVIEPALFKPPGMLPEFPSESIVAPCALFKLVIEPPLYKPVTVPLLASVPIVPLLLLKMPVFTALIVPELVSVAIVPPFHKAVSPPLIVPLFVSVVIVLALLKP